MSKLDTNEPTKARKHWLPTRGQAVRIAVWYAVFSVAWVVGTGWMLHHWVHDPARAVLLEDVKGWVFVLVTALLLGFSLERTFRSMRRAVRRITESETRLHLVGDNLPESYLYQYTLGPEGRPQFTYLSAGVERVHGLSAAEILRDSRCLMAQVDPAVVADFAAAEQESARTLTDFALEFSIRRPDGQVRFLNLRSRPRRNEQGQVVWEGLATDITSRKHAEQAAREREELLAVMGRTAKVGGWDLDPQTGEGHWTEEVARIHGLEPSVQPTREMSLAFYPGESRARIAAAVQAAIDQGTPYDLELEMVSAQGVHKWVRTIGHPVLEQGRVTRLRGSLQDITELKQAEQARHQSEERLRLLTETIDEVFWMADVTISQMVYISSAYERIWGRSTESLRREPRSFIAAIHPEDRERVVAGLRVQETGQPFEQEYRVVRPDGSLRWVLDRGFPLRNAAGQLTHYVGVAIDVTERKLAELALRQSEERFVKLFHSSPSAKGISRMDNGRFVDVNEAFVRLYGYSREELLGHTSEELGLWHSANRAQVIQELREKKRVRGIEMQARRKDGQVRDILVSLELLELDGVACMVGSLIDITELKQAEAALRRSERNYREIFDATNEAIFLHDATTGLVLDVNAAMLRLYGYERKEEVVSADFGNSLTDEPPYDVEAALQRLRLAIEQGPQVFEWRAHKRNGERFWVEVSLRSSQIGGEGRVLAVVRDISERKRAEEALREREQQLQLFFQHSPLAVAMFDRNMCYLAASQRWLSDYRLGQVNLVGRSHYEVFPEIPERWKALHRRCLAGAIEQCEADEFPRADGTTDWLRWEVRPWRTAQGEVGGVIIFSELITERKRAEEALRRSEEEFRAMFEVASVGMAQADPQTFKFLRVNRKMCEITGYSEAELLQLRVPALTHPEDHERDQALYEAIARGDSPDYHIEKRYVRKDGTLAWVNVNVAIVRDGAGRPVRAMAAIEDITERKRTEEMLRLRSAALEAAANAIAITDRAGNLEWANPAFSTLTGYAPAEFLGMNVRLLRSGRQDPAFYKDLWNTILQGRIWHNDLVNRRKDGSLYEEDMTITPLRDARGEISHFIAIKQDITERKQLQAQVQQSQKMEAVGKLAGGIAHDFNNLLAVMLMQTDLAAEVAQLPAEVQEGLAQIRAAAERAANLTRQLLLFSRKQVMQPRDLDLNEVVTSLSKMLRRIIGEDIQLQLHLHSGSLLVHADAGMLDQVLLNLAVNARDAMPEGGRLLLETAEKTLVSTAGHPHPDAAPGRYVWLSVTDNGCGIPPEVLPRIFEPFFTTKEVGKGTGLGLATVFGIVKQHRGWIEVDSQPGQGARFQIFLPATTAAAPGKKEAAAPSAPRGTETILLAEDDPALRLITRRLLQKQGYTVITAADGPEALQLWAQHRQAVALLVTDLVMPGGLSGQQLARQLQADQPGLKVIYTSGYSPEVARHGLELRPGENFIQKPYPPNHLLESVRRCLDT